MKLFLISCLALFVFICTPAFAKPSWPQWVAQLKAEAVAQGIDADLFDRIFATIPEPDHKVLHFDKSQPEHRLTYLEYQNSRANEYKILIGREKYQKYKTLLETIGKQYHVDPCTITALWGMESSYGSYMGKFPVIKSLATLSYDQRRGNQFRKELLLALHIVNDGQISFQDYKGEWAGASGQPQFLPSSWFKYAVDYDHSGRKDIWTNQADVFASIANYLTKNGWQSHEPAAIAVTLPSDFPTDLIGKQKKSISEWAELDVHTANGENLPDSNIQASIIELEGGSTFLIYPNFNVIMTYNNSNYYAATIVYLGNKICERE